MVGGSDLYIKKGEDGNAYRAQNIYMFDDDEDGEGLTSMPHVTLTEGVSFNIPSDLPEEGIQVCVNGKWSTMTKMALQDKLKVVRLTAALKIANKVIEDTKDHLDEVGWGITKDEKARGADLEKRMDESIQQSDLALANEFYL